MKLQLCLTWLGIENGWSRIKLCIKNVWHRQPKSFSVGHVQITFNRHYKIFMKREQYGYASDSKCWFQGLISLGNLYTLVDARRRENITLDDKCNTCLSKLCMNG